MIDAVPTAEPASGPAILLLAAGAGRRFGGAKQLAPLQGQPMLRRSALTALTSGAPVLLVTGARADAVEACVADLPLWRERHAGWDSGLGSSIAHGIAALRRHRPQASGALICLADQPLVDHHLLRRMLARHAERPGWILAADHGERHGPPVLFPATDFAQLQALDGADGALALLRQHAERVEAIAAPQAAWDIDTMDDYQRIQALLDKS